MRATRLRRVIGRISVALVAVMASTLLAASPAHAANSTFCWLDLGDSSCWSGPLHANYNHEIYVHLVPDGSGISSATWDVFDNANGVVVGRGTMGSGERRIRISGLYGNYVLGIHCTNWVKICLDGGRLEQF